jgi:hypothetical protein
MKPIWYFVGMLLTAIGVIIVGAGIYYIFVPPDHQTVLGETNPNLWWGSVILVSGILFLLVNRNKIVE